MACRPGTRGAVPRTIQALRQVKGCAAAGDSDFRPSLTRPDRVMHVIYDQPMLGDPFKRMK